MTARKPETGKRGVTRLPRTPKRGEAQPVLTLRVDFGEAGALGPGKVRLLELIAEQGSISAAGRAMGMSYRRAWLLIENLNTSFKAPLVGTQHGGRAGGGASLTELGQSVVDHYRRLEADAHASGRQHLKALQRCLS